MHSLVFDQSNTIYTSIYLRRFLKPCQGCNRIFEEQFDHATTYVAVFSHYLDVKGFRVMFDIIRFYFVSMYFDTVRMKITEINFD